MLSCKQTCDKGDIRKFMSNIIRIFKAHKLSIKNFISKYRLTLIMLIILAIISCLKDSLYYGMGSYSVIVSKEIGNLFDIYSILIPIIIGLTGVSFVAEVIKNNKQTLSFVKSEKVSAKEYILGYIAQALVNLIKVLPGSIIIYIIMMLFAKAFRNNPDMVNYEMCVTLMSVHLYFILVFLPSILLAITDTGWEKIINLQRKNIEA